MRSVWKLFVENFSDVIAAASQCLHLDRGAHSTFLLEGGGGVSACFGPTKFFGPTGRTHKEL